MLKKRKKRKGTLNGNARYQRLWGHVREMKTPSSADALTEFALGTEGFTLLRERECRFIMYVGGDSAWNAYSSKTDETWMCYSLVQVNPCHHTLVAPGWRHSHGCGRRPEVCLWRRRCRHRPVRSRTAGWWWGRGRELSSTTYAAVVESADLWFSWSETVLLKSGATYPQWALNTRHLPPGAIK